MKKLLLWLLRLFGLVRDEKPLPDDSLVPPAPVEPAPPLPPVPTPTPPAPPNPPVMITTSPVEPPSIPPRLDAAFYWNFAAQWGDTRTMIEARNAPLPPGWSWEDAYASKAIVESYAPQGPAQVDKRTVRNLSGSQGNQGILDGPAGAFDLFLVQEPKDSRVEITAGATQSAFGALTHAVMVGPNGEREECTGSNVFGKLKFIASGGPQMVRVTLTDAGALSVQRNFY